MCDIACFALNEPLDLIEETCNRESSFYLAFTENHLRFTLEIKTRASRWRAIAYPRASAIAYIPAHQSSKCIPPVLIHRAYTCDSVKVLAKKA